jgi:flagellar biosynthesis protein FliR
VFGTCCTNIRMNPGWQSCQVNVAVMSSNWPCLHLHVISCPLSIIVTVRSILCDIMRVACPKLTSISEEHSTNILSQARDQHKAGSSLPAICFMLVSCLAYASMSKIDLFITTAARTLSRTLCHLIWCQFAELIHTWKKAATEFYYM